ncbi:MAG: type II toxin-antitoxin system VapC family toxin [Verrucomicrobiota bacterium]|jgi:predicted nucleic acid-binding protein
MATKVLDSWALMAFLHDEPAAEEVEKLLLKAAEDKHKLLLCVVNWGEIYYSIARAEGEAVAEQKAADLGTLAIELVPVADDLQLVREAAKLKAVKKMAYADCFAGALAKIRNAELVTGDVEFKEIEKEVKICWLQ